MAPMELSKNEKILFAGMMVILILAAAALIINELISEKSVSKEEYLKISQNFTRVEMHTDAAVLNFINESFPCSKQVTVYLSNPTDYLYRGEVGVRVPEPLKKATMYIEVTSGNTTQLLYGYKIAGSEVEYQEDKLLGVILDPKSNKTFTITVNVTRLPSDLAGRDYPITVYFRAVTSGVVGSYGSYEFLVTTHEKSKVVLIRV